MTPVKLENSCVTQQRASNVQGDAWKISRWCENNSSWRLRWMEATYQVFHPALCQHASGFLEPVSPSPERSDVLALFKFLFSL